MMQGNRLSALGACGLAALLAFCGAASAQDDTAPARQVYAEVNRQSGSLRKTGTLARLPGVAYVSEVRAWSDASGVRKLEITDRDDDGDVVTEYYYANGALAFAYRAVKGFNTSGKQATRLEERQYFADGRMFKWLSGMDKAPNAPAGAEFAKESRARLAASAFYLQAVARAAGAKEPATVEIGREIKRTAGTVTELQNGDVACMMMLKDDEGVAFMESGDFPICSQKPSLVGKRVALSYEMANVMAAECQGDVNCRKSDRIALVSKARIIGATVEPGLGSKAATAGQASFCTPQETIVFSCRAGAKLASVCASPDASPTSGHVQYRFGKPDSREPPEMILPEGRPVPARAASGASVAFSGGGGAWLRFRKEPFAYVAYTGIGRWGPKGETREKAGVAVERNGKAVANIKCSGPVTSLLGPEWFDKAGVKPGNEDFEFPD
jgi:hypothetical protein